MNNFVSITDFRNNIFDYSDFIAKNNEIFVERNNKTVFKVVPVYDDNLIKAKKLYELFTNRKRILTTKEDKKLIKATKMFRNKKEIDYFTSLGD